MTNPNTRLADKLRQWGLALLADRLEIEQRRCRQAEQERDRLLAEFTEEMQRRVAAIPPGNVAQPAPSPEPSPSEARELAERVAVPKRPLEMRWTMQGQAVTCIRVNIGHTSAQHDEARAALSWLDEQLSATEARLEIEQRRRRRAEQERDDLREAERSTAGMRAVVEAARAYRANIAGAGHRLIVAVDDLAALSTLDKPAAAVAEPREIRVGDMVRIVKNSSRAGERHRVTDVSTGGSFLLGSIGERSWWRPDELELVSDPDPTAE